MITKAIIKQLNSSNNNHCLVFIPLLKKANATEADATVDATFITIRGIDNIYKVGDVVFVDFEDGEYNKPVILGKLFVERDDPDDVTTTIVAKATQTTTTSKLPESTYLGENTSDSLVTKVERAEYLSESNYENKQDKLISGTNLKTVNGESLLGTGNIAISETGDDLVTITTPQTISGAKTLSSTLSLATNFYYDSANTCGLNANNSDIIGINGLYTHDLANGTAEGLRFYADGGKWDTLTSSNGTLYYRAGGTLLNEDFATAYKVYHTGNLSTATTSSNGLMSSSDKSNLDSHISNTSNPHGVTKAQVGLGSVANTADSATPIKDGTTKFTTGGAYTELAKKLSLSGGTLSGAVTFANNTWNTMGDDCKIGDFNKAGTIGIMGAGNGGSTNTTLAFCKVGDASTYKTITFDGTTLSMDGYASSAGNSTTVGGYTPKVTGEWGTIPVIKAADGVMEIGKYIDFHATAVGNQTGGGNDHDGRITGQVGGGTLTIPQKSGTIAVTGDIPATLPNPNVIKFKDKDNNDASYNGASELDLSGGIYYATTAGSAGSATKAAQDSSGNTISDTYVKKSGGTFSQGAFFLFPDTGNWSANNSGVTFPYSCGGFKWVEQSDWVQLSCEATSSDNCNLVLQFGDDNSNKLSVRNYSGTETAAITANGGIYGQALYEGTTNIANTYLKLSGGTVTGNLTVSGDAGFNYSGIGAGSVDAYRVVWFADNTAKGKPVYDNDFMYNPSTNVLKLDSGRIVSDYASGTWINSASNATLTCNYTTYGGIFSAATKNGRVSLSTYPASDNNVYLNYFTADQIAAGTNSANNQLYWDAANNALHATTFVGQLSGSVDSATNATYASNFGTSSAYCSYDLKTNNTTDTWVPVLNGVKLQHRVIPTAYNNDPSTLSVAYAAKAAQDSDGNTISNTYVKKTTFSYSDGTLTISI